MVMEALKTHRVGILFQISDFVKVKVAQNSHKFNEDNVQDIKTQEPWLLSQSFSWE